MMKWTITRPPFRQTVDNVEIMSPGVSMEIEFGSAKEAHTWFTENDATLAPLYGGSLLDKIGFEEAIAAEGGAEQEAPATGKPPRKPRTPKAEAPAPLPVPGAAPAAPDMTPNANGIPAALDRTNPSAVVNQAPPAVAAPAPPPPPPLPNAPPIAPAAPVNVLATKVVAELERRAKGSADGGAALANWLASAGVVKAGTTYGEAIAAVALATDVQLGPVAGGLGVS